MPKRLPFGVLIAVLAGCGAASDQTVSRNALHPAQCAGGLSRCASGCADLQSDDANCGSCGTACGQALHCVSATCVPSNIKHVVLIVQENHTFDNYFGLYCQAPAGSNPSCTSGSNCCEGAPAAEPGGAAPVALDDSLNRARDPNHSQACELQQIDQGAMDQFAQGSSIGPSLCDSSCSDSRNFALADQTAVGTYWHYAASNALADRYFQPIAGSSSSNDMYFAVAHSLFTDNDLAPQSAGAGCMDPLAVCLNPTFTSYSGQVTIADLLVAARHSFGVYADGYADAAAAGAWCASIPDSCPYDVLHPVLQQSCLYEPSDIPFEYYAQLADHPKYMHDYHQLARDVARGTLPDFSFIKARAFRNEHAEFSTISDGVQFVSQTVSLILNSPYQDDTLILLTWDEGGGYFDHVPPPPATDTDQAGNAVPHGTRVPLLALGRFARANTVSHVVMDHASIVRFLEYNFVGKVGLLHAADANVNNLGSLLDPAQTGIVVPEQ